MISVNLLIEQLKSWSRGYLPPSAQITMGDAANMLTAMSQEIEELKSRIEKLESEPNEPAPIKAPLAKIAPKKRVKKVV